MESWWDRKFYFPLHLPFDAFGPNKRMDPNPFYRVREAKGKKSDKVKG